MHDSMPCFGGRWCTRSNALLGAEGIPSAPSGRPRPAWFCTFRPAKPSGAIPDCGVIAVGRGRRQARLHGTPCFGTPVRLLGPIGSGVPWAQTVRGTHSPRNTRWQERAKGPGKDSDSAEIEMGRQEASGQRRGCTRRGSCSHRRRLSASSSPSLTPKG